MAGRYWQHAVRRAVIALPQNKTGTAASAGRKKFSREARLLRSSDFDAVYRTGKRRSNSQFTIFSRANQLPESRFGFSIKKALGGAVVRNRMRRRMREIIRANRQEIPAGWDIVIHPKNSVASAEFAALAADLLSLLKGTKS